MHRRAWLKLSTCWLIAGCEKRHAAPAAAGTQRVVLYCAQDVEYIETIMNDFRQATGIRVDIKGDTEANKTVGLFESLRRERSQPRADVFWCNEPLLMHRLAKEKLLEPYRSPAAADFPDWTRPDDHAWQGFAARARIIITQEALPKEERPQGLLDLAEPRWKDQAAMAKPFFGTTATHWACLYSHWGPEKTKDFGRKLKANVTLLAGNKDVARAVAAGRFKIGLTDTDDAIIEVQRGQPVDILYPDQNGMGTLFLPNAIALIKSGPNPEAGKQLIDYLLQPDIEKRLAEGPSAQIPLNPKVAAKLSIATPKTVASMKVDFGQAAEAWEAAQAMLRELFGA